MPNIQTELRVQIEGSGTPALVRRSSLQVSSCQQISLSVEGVKPQGANAAAQKGVMQATYKPDLQNVKFAAIYDAGQGSGLKVKIGNGKFTTLAQPLVFTERAAAAFDDGVRIVVQNESSSARSAVLLVGWDLPEGDRKVELVPAPKKAAAKAGKKAKAKKKAAAKAGKKAGKA